MLALEFLAALERVSGKKLQSWLGKDKEPMLRAVREGRQKKIRIPDNEFMLALCANWPFPAKLVRTPSLEHLQAANLDLGHKALELFFFAHADKLDALDQPASRLLELVRHLDELWWRILKAIEDQDLERLREIILGDNLLPPEYWQQPFGPGDGVRQSLRSASTMVEAETAVQMLGWNCQLSVMALWDHEFRGSMFATFKVAPLFLFLMPREKGARAACVRGARDMVELPFDLLFQLVAAIYIRLYGRWNDRGDARRRHLVARDPHLWPVTAPSARDMAACFKGSAEPQSADGQGTDDYKKLIDRLMSGDRPLTAEAFNNATKPPPLMKDGRCIGGSIENGFMPLLIAAHLWDMRLVRRAKRSKPSRVVQCNSEYLRFWNMHRSDLQARGFDVAGGDIPWPAYLQERWLNAQRSSGMR